MAVVDRYTLPAELGGGEVERYVGGPHCEKPPAGSDEDGEYIKVDRNVGGGVILWVRTRNGSWVVSKIPPRWRFVCLTS